MREVVDAGDTLETRGELLDASLELRVDRGPLGERGEDRPCVAELPGLRLEARGQVGEPGLDRLP